MVVPKCIQMTILTFTLIIAFNQLPELYSTLLLDWVTVGDLVQLLLM